MLTASEYKMEELKWQFKKLEKKHAEVMELAEKLRKRLDKSKEK